MRAWEELWRPLADGLHRIASREAAMAETPYTAYSYPEEPIMAVRDIHLTGLSSGRG
jgi:hypothetical protein